MSEQISVSYSKNDDALTADVTVWLPTGVAEKFNIDAVVEFTVGLEELIADMIMETLIEQTEDSVRENVDDSAYEELIDFLENDENWGSITDDTDEYDELFTHGITARSWHNDNTHTADVTVSLAIELAEHFNIDDMIEFTLDLDDLDENTIMDTAIEQVENSLESNPFNERLFEYLEDVNNWEFDIEE